MPRNAHVVLAVSLLFFSSAPLFAASLRLMPAAAIIAGSLCGLAVLWTGLARGALLQQPIDWAWLAACALFSLALAVLGGEGGFVFAKDDWLIRDAVLADLSSHGSPPIYATEQGPALLRAPLGMYLLPAMVGRMLSLPAAHFALIAQTSAILGGFFYAVTLVWPKRRALFVLLFALFAGIDLIPVLIKTSGEWLPRYLGFWVDRMYYPANLSQLFWSPNHALPGFWFAALAALHLRREIDLPALAAASVPLVFWSPLTVAGCVALFIFFALREPRALATLRFGLACVAGLGFAPILAYLSCGAAETPHELQFLSEDFQRDYPVFVLFSLPQALFVALLWRRLEVWFRGGLLASIALLLVIPAFGLGSMSDFVQRASIAPHALLAFGFDQLLIDLIPVGGPALAVGLAMALVAAATPALELWDSLTTPRWPISDCDLATASRKYNGRIFVSNYFTQRDSVPRWLLGESETKSPIAASERLCWPGRVFGEARFNYMKPERRIWLKKSAEAVQR